MISSRKQGSGIEVRPDFQLETVLPSHHTRQSERVSREMVWFGNKSSPHEEDLHLDASAEASGVTKDDTMTMAAWMPDGQAKACSRCCIKFGLTLRRHHCRYCGLVFCVRCCAESIHGALVPPLQRRKEFKAEARAQSVLRVCVACDSGLRGFCASLRLGSSHAAHEFLRRGLQGRVYALAQDRAGYTFVHLAVLSGSTAALGWLLDALQDGPPGVLLLKDRRGRTPLCLAAAEGHLDQARLLVQDWGAVVSEVTDAKAVVYMLQAQ